MMVTREKIDEILDDELFVDHIKGDYFVAGRAEAASLILAELHQPNQTIFDIEPAAWRTPDGLVVICFRTKN
jgi:hypothetical protein